MPKLGLVTVLFNSDDVLEGFFKSITAQKFDNYHLYLIDNTPSPRTDKLIVDLLKLYPLTAYTHIKNSENYGVAKGNNQGIELSIAARCSHTILLNNDIEFHQENVFGSMFERAINNDEYIIIPKILFYDNRKIWMAGGKFINYKGTNLHEGEGNEDGPEYNQEKYFDYAPTCFMLIDNLVFKKVGLMDEKYFVYYDDTDFIYRAKNQGFKILYLPDLTILHKVSSLTGGSESLFSIYYSNRNRIYYIRKNFKGIQFLIAMTVTLVSRMIKYCLYDSKERQKLYQAVFDGLKL